MSNDMTNSAKEEIGALRQDRKRLVQHIRKSQETITRSQELLRHIDDMLAKAGHKPRLSAPNIA
jgi:hypothetical protein